jgi:hypothetical protein
LLPSSNKAMGTVENRPMAERKKSQNRILLLLSVHSSELVSFFSIEVSKIFIFVFASARKPKNVKPSASYRKYCTDIILEAF